MAEMKEGVAYRPHDRKCVCAICQGRDYRTLLLEKNVLASRFEAHRQTIKRVIQCHGVEPQGITPEQLLPELLRLERAKVAADKNEG